MKKVKIMLRSKVTGEYKTISCLHCRDGLATYPAKNVDKKLIWSNYGDYYKREDKYDSSMCSGTEYDLVATFKNELDIIINDYIFGCRSNIAKDVSDKLSVNSIIDGIYVHYDNVDVINLGDKTLLTERSHFTDKLNYSKRGNVSLIIMNESHKEMDWEIIY